MNQRSCIEVNGVTFLKPNGEIILQDISFGLGREKTGFVGRNGIGKTTLMKIICGQLPPESGHVAIRGKVGYLPQNLEEFHNQTVIEVLGIKEKLEAVRRVFAGDYLDEDLELIENDWGIESEAHQLLCELRLEYLEEGQRVETLSGGELNRLVLASVVLKKPDYLILDEPTNNLDKESRQNLYRFVEKWKNGLLVISHDRELLSHMDQIMELSTLGLKVYGGNYEAYKLQKEAEVAAAEFELENARQALKKVESQIQRNKEVKQKRDSRGKRLREKIGIPKILLNAMRGRAEGTDGRLAQKFEQQLEAAKKRKQEAWEKVSQRELLKFDLNGAGVPNGKVIMECEEISFSYPGEVRSVIENLHLRVVGPERIAITGSNGSGKSTFFKIIMGALRSTKGDVKIKSKRMAYLDQHIECLDANKTILENFKMFNPDLSETEQRHALAKFLFSNEEVFKPINVLSGGERIRAGLACILMAKEVPELLILDEPTNHLDLESLEAIEKALIQYQGALLVASHDDYFLKRIGVQREVRLSTFK